MLKITFNEADVQALQQQRFAHPEAVVRVKMEALYLKSQGVAHQDIARWCGISTNTLRRYFRQYLAGGLEQLQAKTRSCPHSALEAHRVQLQAAFQQHPPRSIAEAAARIAALTGIRRQPTQVRAFLQALGFKRLKVGSLPAKADAAQQERFLQEQLQPRLEEAKAAQRTVFFMDAAHFVYGPFLGFVWCLARLFIKAPCGRQRLNVLAALHAVTQEVITITNSTYITAESVCLLLCEIAHSYPAQALTVVLDNARYQRCLAVQECAALLDIELLYLPPYSPNLNLIERFWKWVKKQCLYGRYYENFSAFQKAILNCIEQAPTQHHKELNSLLTLRFQTLSKAPPVTA